MSCAEIARLLGPYEDGELDAARCLEIDDHLSQCDSCARSLDELHRLGAALRSPSLRFETTPGFEKRMRGALPRHRDMRWLAIAASLLIVVFVGWRFAPRPANQELEHDLMNSHIRSLMAEHLVDIPSSDRHTVKPWFTGKIDFSPQVDDFAAQGFPLSGGRLDYIGGRPVAALVYQRNKHVVNVYIWPGETAARSGADDGYQFEHWNHAGMSYWAVSDLNPTELDQLARLLGRP